MNKLVILNRPSDCGKNATKLVLWQGYCSSVDHYVYYGSLEDALDEMVDYISAHCPRDLCNDTVQEDYDRRQADHPEESEEDSMSYATVDVTCAGNCGDYILSAEWGIAAENPTRGDMKRLAEGREVVWQ